MTVEDMIVQIEEMENAQYNAARLRQTVSDTFVDMVSTMLPRDWEDVVEPKEKQYQELMKSMSMLRG